jgi:membrane protein YdbS with pleckstrin-like domain
MSSQIDERETLLAIQPSQWTNIGWYALSILAMLIYFPLGVLITIASIYKYIEVLTWKYTCRTKGIEERKGVFSVTREEVQYFRIKSIKIDEPFLMRIVGLSIVHIISSERYKPNMVLYGIKNGESIKNKLNAAAYEWRNKLGVRDYDIY